MAILLREFNLADYDAVYAIWQSAGPGIGIGRSDTRDEIAKKLQRDPDLFLVAQEEDNPATPLRIIGTVIGGYDGRRGLIYHLAVEDAYRGRGVAKILMDEIERRLIAKGCLKAYLLVLQGEPETAEFYEHRGWETMLVTIMGKSFQPECQKETC
jgi:ribosomal protein S18 acetylase RimI-like enzyme